MDFKEKVLENLKKYKEGRLDIKEYGKYNYRGKIVKREHILPEGLENKNFIQGVTSSEKLKSQDIKLHNCYSHLNSSQVMCINFFEKIRTDENVLRNLILNLLDVKLEGKIVSAFEYEPNNKEGTNFDFYIECGEIKIYWEIKYTEGKFATTNANKVSHTGEKHIERYNKVYKGIFEKSKYLKNLGSDNFFDNYQIYRNISYIKNDNDYVVFLYPYEDVKLDNQIKNVIKRHKCEDNVFAIDWGEIYKILFDIIKNDENYRKYYLEFEGKYLKYIVK